MLRQFAIRLRVPASRPRLVVFQSTLASAVKEAQSWQPFNQTHPIANSNLDYDAQRIAMQKKQRIQYERALKKRKIINPSVHLREGSNEEVLQLEVEDLLTSSNLGESLDGVAVDSIESDRQTEPLKSLPSKPPIELGTEIELDIVELSSTGEGLAYTASKDHVVVIPFSVPGDRVVGRVYRWLGNYSHADFIKVVEPSKTREGITPKCKYFADCGGCQLQMIPYEQQLVHKRKIVEKAFRNFSGLRPEQVPSVRETMGSPLQYHYRTKLSPHFDGPRRRKSESAKFTSIPKVGFNRKNRHEVMDIECCPIGTDILQEGLKQERAKVAVNYQTYRNGKTILLRESTTREPEDLGSGQGNISTVAEFDTTSKPTSIDLQQLSDGRPELVLTFSNHTDRKTCTSAETSMTTEYIGPHKFINRAGSFFQNNNSILGPFTKYIYDNCMLPATALPSSASPITSSSPSSSSPAPIKYLLDAYCGSGLFTVTLSKLFSSALGIDIDPKGIEAARQNASINRIPNAGFIEADATDLFADVPFPPDQSLVIIDPPRKGASEDFLRQLCQFRAKRVVYVSCNVHTQARDVGIIVKGFGTGGGCRYQIESLRGFDFFPQTGHVEGVCVLNRVDEPEEIHR